MEFKTFILVIVCVAEGRTGVCHCACLCVCLSVWVGIRMVGFFSFHYVGPSG